MNHCGKTEENRQLTEAAETYILSFEKDLKTNPIIPIGNIHSQIIIHVMYKYRMEIKSDRNYQKRRKHILF